MKVLNLLAVLVLADNPVLVLELLRVVLPVLPEVVVALLREVAPQRHPVRQYKSTYLKK
jgi:hypothetical protein